MANESAVENLSELTTVVTCSGCGKDLNLLVEHLRVTISPTRNVIEMVDAALVGAETDDEGNITALAVDVTQTEVGSRDRFYIASRSGEGMVGQFHNYLCLTQFAEERAESGEFQDGENVKLTVRTHDPDAEARGVE